MQFSLVNKKMYTYVCIAFLSRKNCRDVESSIAINSVPFHSIRSRHFYGYYLHFPPYFFLSRMLARISSSTIARNIRPICAPQTCDWNTFKYLTGSSLTQSLSLLIRRVIERVLSTELGVQFVSMCFLFTHTHMLICFSVHLNLFYHWKAGNRRETRQMSRRNT